MRECTPTRAILAPLIIAERRILIFLSSFVSGIAAFHLLPDRMLWGTPVLNISILAGLAILFLTGACFRVRHRPWLGRFAFAGVCAAAGVLVAALQYTVHQPIQLEKPLSVGVVAQVTHIDGRASGRSRLWLKLQHINASQEDLSGAVVRVTTDRLPTNVVVGAHLRMRVRLFPPPSQILPGTPDFGRNARVAGITASGFVTSKIDVLRRPDALSYAVRVNAVRSGLATHIQSVMPAPAIGIAAALVVGDRRFIDERVYDLFRASGLAHLLAISGLHMGLLCFGFMAALRCVAALWPVRASRFAVHKYAAAFAVGVGAVYVVLSGASVSAVRAFIMALLIILAVISDRRALTIRNVALAAFVILALNPVALFSAGFQLSFAATSLLVMLYERSLFRPPSRHHRLLRYGVAIMMASLVANCATAPFAAQHFGSFTSWGVIANMIGIPLTGFWIMPSAFIYLVSLPLGLGGLSGPVFELGINVLIATAEFFAHLPLAHTAVAPPGYGWISVGVVGVICSYVMTRPARWFGSGLIISAMLGWWLTPLPDAAVFIQHHGASVIFSDPKRALLLYGSLSEFLVNMARLRLGGQGDSAEYQDCALFCRHPMPAGDSIAIVLHRRGLSGACDDQHTAYILSLVVPFYPCKSTKTIYYIDEGLPRNYLLFIGKNRIKTQSSSSLSGQLTCLEPQPLRC